MNKYEIALDEITVQFLAMRNMVKGYSSERDKDLLDTLHEAVIRVTATNDGIDPYVSLSEYKKGRNAFVRLNRCKPYFFEDLREGMYVYDKKLRRIVMIEDITEGQNIISTATNSIKLMFIRYHCKSNVLTFCDVFDHYRRSEH